MASDPREKNQASPDFPSAFYRVVMKGILVRDGKILMVEDTVDAHEKKYGFQWEMPGGGLDFGEDFQEAFKREVQEEMGLEVTSMATKPLYIWTAKREHLRNMEWHYVLILMFPFEVKNLEFTPTDECKSIRFFTIDELREEGDKVSDQILPLLEHFKAEDFSAK